MDPHKEAKSIPEQTHFYWISAEHRVGFMPCASCCGCIEDYVSVLTGQ